MTNFCFCNVPKKVERASMAICKKYKSMVHDGCSDKSVFFKMDDNEFRAMKREFEAAGLDYIIEIEGEDYTA